MLFIKFSLLVLVLLAALKRPLPFVPVDVPLHCVCWVCLPLYHCFTAGVGEYGPVTRGMVLKYFEFLGVKIDEQLNDKIFGQQTVISTPDSTIKVAVVPTNEELAIARDTLALVK